MVEKSNQDYKNIRYMKFMRILFLSLCPKCIVFVFFNSYAVTVLKTFQNGYAVPIGI